MRKVELLAPAGDFEKLKIALHYGADAVYIGGDSFGLRANAGNFTRSELQEAIIYTHRFNKKIYLTINSYPRNYELDDLIDYLHFINTLELDALIVADPGVLYIIENENIKIPIHLSTQATTVNWADIKFWMKLPNIERVVLSRELSKNEISFISDIIDDFSLEIFIHGAMCMSYSGRCLISNYLINRDANRGECAQPCRWQYALVEEKRPNQYFPIEEDKNGTYIFNSSDMCLANELESIISIKNVDSLKVEGRMKSVFYVATIIRAYRKLIDYYSNPNIKNEEFDLEFWLSEFDKISHRPYSKGFFINNDQNNINLISADYIQPRVFCGIVIDFSTSDRIASIQLRNCISVGDIIEFISPSYNEIRVEVKELFDADDIPIKYASKAMHIYKIRISKDVYAFDIIRKLSDNNKTPKAL